MAKSLRTAHHLFAYLVYSGILTWVTITLYISDVVLGRICIVLLTSIGFIVYTNVRRAHGLHIASGIGVLYILLWGGMTHWITNKITLPHSSSLDLPNFHVVYRDEILAASSDGDMRSTINGPNGVTVAPYSDTKIAHLIQYAIRTVMAKPVTPYITDTTISVVIPGRDENPYISKTIQYLLLETPEEHLGEIIIVDDASTTPLEETVRSQLSDRELRKVRFFRFSEKNGLIRARIKGADEAQFANILFLDGHCRVKRGWTQFIFTHLQANYKRIVSPTIQDIRPTDWSDVGTHGAKMFFDWFFEFAWFEDPYYEVPLSSGGIVALTKKWWVESGKYDSGMLEWGAENFEQSFRAWLCGGEIVYTDKSFVGHIFDRPAKPNPGNSLVRQIQKNQKRAALVWLDEYYSYFDQIHLEAKPLDPGPNLDERIKLRHMMSCLPYSWYVNKFRSCFDRRSLLLKESIMIQHIPSRKCLTGIEGKVMLSQCSKSMKSQWWLIGAGNRFLINIATSQCLTRSSKLLLKECQWLNLLTGSTAQLWQFDHITSKRIMTFPSMHYERSSGNDRMKIFPLSMHEPNWNSLCLESTSKFYLTTTESETVYLTKCKQLSNHQGLMLWNDSQAFYIMNETFH